MAHSEFLIAGRVLNEELRRVFESVGNIAAATVEELAGGGERLRAAIEEVDFAPRVRGRRERDPAGQHRRGRQRPFAQFHGLYRL